MVEQIRENLYRIEVPLPGSALRVLNSYYLRGKDRDLLIDTGFRCRESYNALKEALDQLGSDPERRDVLLTHFHTDHSGMADLFVGKTGRVYIGRVDLNYYRCYLAGSSDQMQFERFVSDGFPPDLMAKTFTTNPARTMRLEKIGPEFSGLQDGDVLSVGDFQLKTILVPGHTPGNCMFWLEREKIMFTGDHVLFDITPNITAWPIIPNSLKSYLESLERAETYPVVLALPAHRHTGNYHERIRRIRQHHAERLEEVVRIIREHPGLTAYEITGRMRWRIHADSWEEFPLTQRYFAVGECLSHLDYLRAQGTIHSKRENGIYHYYE